MVKVYFITIAVNAKDYFDDPTKIIIVNFQSPDAHRFCGRDITMGSSSIAMQDVLSITYEEVRDVEPLPFRRSIDIYTDGSKTDSAVGYAFVVYEYTQEIYYKVRRLDPSTTISQAELIGLVFALEYVKSSSSISRVRIFTDSRSALQALSGNSQTDEHISQCRQLLSHLYSQGTTVDFFWTRAHVGIPGNERADELAKMSTNPGTSNNFPMSSGFPLRATRPSLRRPYFLAQEDRDRFMKTLNKATLSPNLMNNINRPIDTCDDQELEDAIIQQYTHPQHGHVRMPFQSHHGQHPIYNYSAYHYPVMMTTRGQAPQPAMPTSQNQQQGPPRGGQPMPSQSPANVSGNMMPQMSVEQQEARKVPQVPPPPQ